MMTACLSVRNALVGSLGGVTPTDPVTSLVAASSAPSLCTHVVSAVMLPLQKEGLNARKRYDLYYVYKTRETLTDKISLRMPLCNADKWTE